MSKRLRASVAIFLLSVLLVCIPLVSPASGKTLTEAQRAAIETAAEYMTGQADWAGRLLQKYCYEPSVPAAVWLHYPAVRKLAIAYEEAEAVNPGIGGDRLLALLSKALAQQYEAVRKEGSLFSYLKMRVSGQPCLEFRRVEQRVFLSALPYDDRNAIITIADYSTRGLLGSQRQVIMAILKHNPIYSETEADAFLVQSATFEDAMMRAYDAVPSALRENLIKDHVAKLVSHYEAVRHEPALKRYLPETSGRSSLTANVTPALAGTQPVLNNNGSSRLPMDLRPTPISIQPDPFGSFLGPKSVSTEQSTKLRKTSDRLMSPATSPGQKVGEMHSAFSKPYVPIVLVPASSNLVANRSGSHKGTRLKSVSTQSDSLGLSLGMRLVLNEQPGRLPIKDLFLSPSSPPRQGARQINPPLVKRHEPIILAPTYSNSVKNRSDLSVLTSGIRLKPAGTRPDSFVSAPATRSVLREPSVLRETSTRSTLGLDDFIRSRSQPPRVQRAPEIYRPLSIPNEPIPLIPVYPSGLGIFEGTRSQPPSALRANPSAGRTPRVVSSECP